MSNVVMSIGVIPPRIISVLRQVEGLLRSNSNSNPTELLSLLQRSRVAIATVIKEMPEAEAVEFARAPWPQFLLDLKFNTPSSLLSPEEEVIAAEVRSSFALGWPVENGQRNFLLARLLIPPFDMPIAKNINRLDAATLRNYFDYLLERPVFCRDNDPADYCRHLGEALDFAEEVIDMGMSNTHVPIVIDSLMAGCDIGVSVSTFENTRPLFEKRPRILRKISSIMGWKDDHPMEEVSRQRLKLGIYAKTLMAGGETWGLLSYISKLPRDRYEIIIFTGDHNVGYHHDVEFARQFYAAIDAVYSVPQQIASMYKMLRGFDLDIFILATSGGTTQMNTLDFVFAHRIARCQMAMHGMWATTTGNPCFDYYIGFEPPSKTADWYREFTEKEIRMPGSFIYVPPHWRIAPTREINRANLGVKADEILFTIGAAAEKILPSMISTWVEILRRVPNSKIVAYPFNRAWGFGAGLEVSLTARFHAEMEKKGVAKDRIIFLKNINAEDVNNLLAVADIYLSSFPYGGITSLSEALRQGCVPVDKTGKWNRENGDANILVNFGLEECLNPTPEAYIESAVKLATDKDFRMALRDKIRKQWEAHLPTRFDEVATNFAKVMADITAKHFA